MHPVNDIAYSVASGISGVTDIPFTNTSQLHQGLDRVEAFDYSPDGLEIFQRRLKALRRKGVKGFSFHMPMPRRDYYPFPGAMTFFLSEDADRRALSFRALEDTLRSAKVLGADYVVTHLGCQETDTADPELAARLARYACARFAELSRDFDLPVHVEVGETSEAFNDLEVIAAHIARHPELGVCLDPGHLFIGAQRFRRSFYQDLDKVAPLAESIHLWNTRGLEDYERHGHIPLHPSQAPENGWMDVPRVLARVLRWNPKVAIIFEYAATMVTGDIQQGFDWVRRLVAEADPAAGTRPRAAGATDRR